MRSNEERVTAVKKRLMEMERQKRRRQRRFLLFASAAACIACIMGMAAAFPALEGKSMSKGGYGSAMVGSIFSGGGVEGYMVIGVVSFILGVCVTIAAYELRKKNRQEEQEDGG